MKKIIHLLSSSLILMVLILGYTNVANAQLSNEQKLPDAFNQQLEVQKLKELNTTSASGNNELKSSDGETRTYLKLNQPLTIKFDDGSSITYSAKVTPAEDTYKTEQFSTNSIKTDATAGNYNFEIEKSYDYLVGYAKIVSHVEGVKVIKSNFGTELHLDGASKFQSVEDTGFATVLTGENNIKGIWNSLYDLGFRARARGSIVYNFNGIQKQQGYDFAWAVDGNKMFQPYFITNY